MTVQASEEMNLIALLVPTLSCRTLEFKAAGGLQGAYVFLLEIALDQGLSTNPPQLTNHTSHDTCNVVS